MERTRVYHERTGHSRLLLTSVCSAAAGVFLIATGASAADVTPERLIEQEPQNWLQPNRDYSATRYSPLDAINRDNVKDLRPAFIVGLRSHNNVASDVQGTPLVDDGMMYLSDGWGRVYKIDVTAGNQGKTQWVNDPAVLEEGLNPRNRGVAMIGNLVVSALLDGRVVAIDRDSGETIWDKQVGGDSIAGVKESFTVSPIAADKYLIVAQSRGDSGTRGWLAALTPETGDETWRWYSIPEPGQPGSETWKDDHNAWRTGGGSFWAAGSYDPEQRVTIWGSGNPVPMFDPEYRPGDNLFTNSAVAVDVDNGDLKWYFQYTPNDSWDFDEIGINLLYDAEVGGQARKVLGHFGRNGFFYQLDRTSGAFIAGAQYTDKVNWTAGLDPKTGKPVEYDPNLDIQRYVTEARAFNGETKQVCPTHHGGLRWQPPAYNPVKFIAYAAGAEGCSEITVKTPKIDLAAGEGPGAGGTRTIPEKYGSLKAFDVRTTTQLAEHAFPFEVKSGVLATGGGLVFTAPMNGWIGAYNDETLEELWTFNLGTTLKAPPMSYAIGDKQYIAILTGGSPDTDIPQGEYQKLEHTPMLVVFALN